MSVTHLQYGLLSPQAIEAWASVRITRAETECGDVDPNLRLDQQEWFGGLADRRMGPTRRGERCQFEPCQASHHECRGHFGVIHLAAPILPTYLVSTVRTALEGACLASPKCPGVLYPRRSARARSTCPVCDAPRAERIDLSRVDVAVRWSAASNREPLTLTMAELIEFLERKPFTVWAALGFREGETHPAWCLWTRLPVLPITARPYHVSSTGKWIPDPTTRAYKDVMDQNAAVEAARGGPRFESVKPLIELHKVVGKLLVGHNKFLPGVRATPDEVIGNRVASYTNNAVATARGTGGGSAKPKSAAEPRRCLVARLAGGKHGRIRNNLLGNRCDETARGVITGTVDLRIDEVGVPLCMARKLTWPVRVTSLNLESVRASLLDARDLDFPVYGFELSRSGRPIEREDHGPLVKRITLRDGKQYAVDDGNLSLVRQLLEPDCIVHRRLCDGDRVLFNRQPSLHPGSLMTFKVVVIAGESLKLREEVANSFNADFDGDEMNIHVPQDLAALAEADTLCSVDANFMTGLPGKPNFGAMMNAPYAAFCLCDADCFVTRDVVMQMVVAGGMGPDALRGPTCFTPARRTPAGVIPARMLWSGRDALSHAFPRGFDWESRDGAPMDAPRAQEKGTWAETTGSRASPHSVLVRDGFVLSGRLSSSSLGAAVHGIVEHIHKRLGVDACKRFLNAFQPLVGVWLELTGCSLCVDDMRVPPAVLRELADDISKTAAEADAGRFAPQASRAPEVYWTSQNSALMSRIETRTWDALVGINPQNDVAAMVLSGAKGKRVNMTMVSACLGLQTLKGAMMRCSPQTGRISPYFSVRNAQTLKNVGFATTNFSRGLSLQDALVHARAGRDGVVDTQRMTPKSGYLARCMVMAAQSIVVAYDGTVRKTGTGDVVQSAYGGVGLNPEALWCVRIEEVRDPQDDVERAANRAVREHLEGGREQATCPFTREELRDALAYLEEEDEMEVTCSLEDAYDLRLEAMCELNECFQHVMLVERLGVVAAALVLWLRPIELAGRPISSVTKAVRLAVRKIRDAVVEPGTAVGVLAALSGSHAATQRTMETFKLAGSLQKKQKRDAIDRSWEILSVAQRQPETQLKLYQPKDSPTSPAEWGTAMQTRIRRIPLARYVASYRVVNAGEPATRPAWERRFDASREVVMPQEPAKRRALVDECTTTAPWALELRFSVGRMQADGVAFPKLVELVRQCAAAQTAVVRCTHTNLNMWDDAPPTVRVYFARDRATRPGFVIAFVQRVVALVVRGFEHMRGAVDFEAPSARDARASVTVLTDPAHSVEAFRSTWRLGDVDHSLTECSHVQTVYRVLGIQAARAAIVKELRETIGDAVSSLHIGLLADVLTREGNPRSIKSSGASAVKTAVAARAAYDQEFKRIVEGSLKAQRDSVLDVASSEIVGATVPLGTGSSFKLLLDEDAVLRRVLEEEEPPPNVDADVAMEAAPAEENPFSPSASTTTTSATIVRARRTTRWGPPATTTSFEEEEAPVFVPRTPSPAWAPPPPTPEVLLSQEEDAFPSEEVAARVPRRAVVWLPPAAPPVAALYSPSSPTYSPSGEVYSPSSPNYTPSGAVYSPSSPTYSPTSPRHGGDSRVAPE